jgi:hypothetical protein
MSHSDLLYSLFSSFRFNSLFMSHSDLIYSLFSSFRFNSLFMSHSDLIYSLFSSFRFNSLFMSHSDLIYSLFSSFRFHCFIICFSIFDTFFCFFDCILLGINLKKILNLKFHNTTYKHINRWSTSSLSDKLSKDFYRICD